MQRIRIHRMIKVAIGLIKVNKIFYFFDCCVIARSSVRPCGTNLVSKRNAVRICNSGGLRIS